MNSIKSERFGGCILEALIKNIHLFVFEETTYRLHFVSILGCVRKTFCSEKNRKSLHKRFCNFSIHWSTIAEIYTNSSEITFAFKGTMLLIFLLRHF